jgi:hypothetical protein
MNTGQMLLSLGALILLSSMVLRFNRTILTSDDVMYNSKFNVLASSLCTSLIEEAKGKAYDNNTDSSAVNNLNELSTVLGPEAGETYSDFNDFDDFNGFVKVDSTMPSAVFYVTSKVNYIDASDPDKISSNPTWRKAITVTVMSSSMKDPVTMSSIYSYWYFR